MLPCYLTAWRATKVDRILVPLFAITVMHLRLFIAALALLASEQRRPATGLRTRRSNMRYRNYEIVYLVIRFEPKDDAQKAFLLIENSHLIVLFRGSLK